MEKAEFASKVEELLRQAQVDWKAPLKPQGSLSQRQSWVIHRLAILCDMFRLKITEMSQDIARLEREVDELQEKYDELAVWLFRLPWYTGLWIRFVAGGGMNKKGDTKKRNREIRRKYWNMLKEGYAPKYAKETLADEYFLGLATIENIIYRRHPYREM